MVSLIVILRCSATTRSPWLGAGNSNINGGAVTGAVLMLIIACVPRRYLRGFADQKERLAAYRRTTEQRITMSSQNATVETGFHSSSTIQVS